MAFEETQRVIDEFLSPTGPGTPEINAQMTTVLPLIASAKSRATNIASLVGVAQLFETDREIFGQLERIRQNAEGIEHRCNQAIAAFQTIASDFKNLDRYDTELRQIGQGKGYDVGVLEPETP